MSPRRVRPAAPVLLALLLGLTHPLSLCAAPAATPVAIHVGSDNPPFMYGASDHAQGIYPALIRAAFAGSPYQPEIGAVPWRRALAELDLGRAGVGGLYRTAARRADYDFSAPLLTERIVLVTRTAHPLHFRGVGDLRGLRLCVRAGWKYSRAYGQARRAGAFQTSETGSDPQALRMLSLGRCDAALSLERTARPLLRQPEFAALHIEAVALSAQSTYLAFHKSAHAGALLQAFNQGLGRLRRSGRYRQLIREARSASAPAMQDSLR